MDRYQATFKTWDKLAATYQEKFMDLDLYNDTYDRFCEWVSQPGAKIFEIGCGPGNVTRYLLAKRPDYKIKAIDIAPSMLELAKHNNPTVDFEVMDCREIDTVTSKFDAVVCGFCLPYLSKDDCRKFIKDCNNLLVPGGVLYFSAIEGDYDKSTYETSSNGAHTMFVYYHEESYLSQYLSENNFEKVEIFRKHYFKADSASSTHIIFIARKPVS